MATAEPSLSESSRLSTDQVVSVLGYNYAMPADDQAVAALAEMSWLERLLFGRSIARRIRNPANRITHRVSTYGIRGATHLELSIFWRLVIFAGALIWIIGQFVTPVLEILGAVVFAVGSILSFWRVATGVRAGRHWRASSQELA